MGIKNPLILLVDDEEVFLLAFKNQVLRLGYQVITASDAESALSLVDSHPVDLVITDLNMPGMDGIELMRKAKLQSPNLTFIVLTARGSVESAVDAVRSGAFDFLEKPLTPQTLDIILKRALEFGRISGENEHLREHFSDQYSFQNIVTNSPLMRQALEVAAHITTSPQTTVSLLGESGVGKEVFARAIHVGSGGLPGNFVGVNCAAIPESLLESELFGHTKGAFTGADKERDGKFSLASGGTILLDEIGDMPLQLQAKLLRVLEERVYEKTGSNRQIPVDFRVIVATHRDLAEQVKLGRFREDLFYRINVVPITIPPLRKRKEDIPLLVDHFLKLLRKHLGKALPGVAQQAMELITAYDWPGNVRELRNVLEYAAIMVGDELIKPGHIRLSPSPSPSPLATDSDTDAVDYQVRIPLGDLSLSAIVDDFTGKVLEITLQRCHGNKRKAADLLKVNRKIFYR
ncbi:sigma-54-dependent transcriptional regulator [Geomonas anaerohicana]|uniref:Sigma-54-dependent Fis family transcriptional regulator n=1 Tax=Geomonas anaerohicana TaxID=2798583 RepID=A0ABS0YAA3_9BACT|nr:sigma-54 dependent transcriptional regulator [Geomonas anaerohicana]MBJ6749217.1 sigma-54-dependent Fis family transcriptional regulator [Geomonas anaerohicana]